MTLHPAAAQYDGPAVYAFWGKGGTINLRAEWSPERDRFIIGHPSTGEPLGLVDVAAFNSRCFGRVLRA